MDRARASHFEFSLYAVNRLETTLNYSIQKVFCLNVINTNTSNIP